MLAVSAHDVVTLNAETKRGDTCSSKKEKMKNVGNCIMVMFFSSPEGISLLLFASILCLSGDEIIWLVGWLF